MLTSEGLAKLGPDIQTSVLDALPAYIMGTFEPWL